MTTRTAPKPADDQPFDFNLDAVKAESNLTPFRVHFDGRRWDFAHMEALDVWDLVEAVERGEVAAMVSIFKAALGEQWEDFRKVRLPQFKMKALFGEYRKYCGLEPGESEASGS
jgi:hypothetical protein